MTNTKGQEISEKYFFLSSIPQKKTMKKFPNWYNKVLLYFVLFNHMDMIFTEELEKGSIQSLWDHPFKTSANFHDI